MYNYFYKENIVSNLLFTIRLYPPPDKKDVVKPWKKL